MKPNFCLLGLLCPFRTGCEEFKREDAKTQIYLSVNESIAAWCLCVQSGLPAFY